MERNQLTLTGTPAVILDEQIVPAEVALLFRGQVSRLPQKAAAAVTLRTICFRRNGTFLLPAGRVVPEQGVEVPRRIVAQLPVDVEVHPAEFPDYAAPLLGLPRSISCLEQAAKIMSSRNLVPHHYGADAVRVAVSDIYAEALAAEERNPGVLFDRLFRREKAVINWFVGLGRNAYRREYRRRRVGERGNQRGIHFISFEDEPRWWHGSGGWGSAYRSQSLADAPSEWLELEELFSGRLSGLAILPDHLQSILYEVSLVGPRDAAATLDIAGEKVCAAIREARALLQAEQLCRIDLGELPEEEQQAIRLAAQVGLSEAAAVLELSTDWVQAAIRSGWLLAKARALLNAADTAAQTIPSQDRAVLLRVARLGLRQGAKSLGMGKTAVNQVFQDVCLRLGLDEEEEVALRFLSRAPAATPEDGRLSPQRNPAPARPAPPASQAGDAEASWTRWQHEQAEIQNREAAALWARRKPQAAAVLDSTCSTCPYSCKNAWQNATLPVGGFCPVLRRFEQLRKHH